MRKESLSGIKNQIILLLTAVGVLSICLLIWYFMQRDMNGEYASDYSDLLLSIKHNDEMIEVKGWQAETGELYFFLPSYVNENTQIRFSNITKEDVVYLDGMSVLKQDNLTDFLEWEKVYQMYFVKNGMEGEENQVVFVKSSQMATLCVWTESESMEKIHNDKTYREKAEITLLTNAGEVEFDQEIDYIRARGKSTFDTMPKKSYQIKLYHKKGLLGMNKTKKWILLGNYIDSTLLRNKFVSDFAAEHTSIPVVQGKYVDLYLNGEYAGNYYLCQKIDVGEEGLQITDLDRLNEALNTKEKLEKGERYVSEDGNIHAVSGVKSPADITGGYLVEVILAEEYQDVRTGFRTDRGYTYEIVSPQNATIQEAEYICKLFNEVETAMFQPDGVNPDTGKALGEYVDIPSWASQYLLNEVFHDPDGKYASVFFYKDKDPIDPLLHAGPLWDFDRALGSYGVHMNWIDMPQGTKYYFRYSEELMNIDSFVEEVKSQFENVICPYVELEARRDIVEWSEMIAASAEMDRLRWPDKYGKYMSYDANVEHINYFLQERVEYLKDVWLKDEVYHTVTFLDYNGQIYDQYTVRHGENLPDVPRLSAYVAVFAGWKSIDTNNSLDEKLPVLEDVTYQSQWIEASVLLENGLNIADIDANAVDLETLKNLVAALEQMQKKEEEKE